MNKLACAAISVAAPTLLLSIGNFLIGLSLNKDFNDSCKSGLQAINHSNGLMLSYNVFLGVKRCLDTECRVYERKQGLRYAIINDVKLTHILVSSSFTYLALTSNTLYAIPAVVTVLSLFYKPYNKSCIGSARYLADKIFDFFSRGSNSNNVTMQ